MLKVLSYILCDLDPKVKVIGQKAGICDGVPSTSALVRNYLRPSNNSRQLIFNIDGYNLLKFMKMVNCLPEFEYFV